MATVIYTNSLKPRAAVLWSGIPNSSSHRDRGRRYADQRAPHRPGGGLGQIWNVLRALAVSPILGLVGAGLLYFVIRHLVHDRHLYEPPRGDTPPAWWVRGLLILTCTSVSFSHGTNYGQKSIGLIMLTIIGLMPAAFALNPNAADQTARLPDYARAATPLIENTATTRSRSR